MKVLIVDDIQMNRDILADVLSDSFEIAEASNGIEALEILKSGIGEIGVMLLDLNMPDMDGIEVLKRMKEANMMDRVPVIVITGDDTRENEEMCLEYGVTDFIRKPFNEAIVKLRTQNSAKLYSMKRGLERQVEQKTIELQTQNERLHEKNEGMIELLGTLVDARDRESGGHIFRVMEYTRVIAADVKEYYPEYRLTEEDVRLMTVASVLHDVGKIMVSDTILLKPGALTPDEFEKMKNHTIYGAEIIKKAAPLWDKEYYLYSEQICHYHHERYDGKGYPEGLEGEQIPISAQIVSLADVFDALTTKRIYKDAIPPAKAYEMITNNETGVFNPKLINSFTRCFPKMAQISLDNHEDVINE